MEVPIRTHLSKKNDFPQAESGRILVNFGVGLLNLPSEGWTPLRPGVEKLVLYETGDAGPSAALVRYAPGAHVPRHIHNGYEHILVFSGTQQDAHGVYGAGTLIINEPETIHEVTSNDGCVVLIVWTKPVTFLSVGST